MSQNDHSDISSNSNQIHPIVTFELEINKFWNSNSNSNVSIKQKYLQKRSNKKFKIVDGPPFATGLPHYGHYLAGSLKDTITRLKTMWGYDVDKTAGWDVHGVPMEMHANKKLNINSIEDIKRIGIDKYCAECKESALTCASAWMTYMDRFSRWANFENPYTTMDFKYCEKVWSMFNILYDNNFISQGYRVSAYSTALETSLSNFESSLNYMTRNDQSLTFQVKLIDFKVNGYEEYDVYISVFTTTPWTLPGNCVIAINKDFNYNCKINDNNTITISLSSDDNNKLNILISGESLLNVKYEPLFDFTETFFGYMPKSFFKIYHGDFVEAGTGTGAVHIAPMFGEEDFNLCIKNNIISQNGENLYDYLTSRGEFIDSVGKYFDSEYVPTVCFQNNSKIIKYIKSNKPLCFIKSEQINHSYPHCWRTNTPLIYRALPSWMVNVSNFKEELIELNKNINWYPSHVGTGRFHQWLSNGRDWNISRSRYWGIPLPVWKQVDDNNFYIVKSAKHLEELCDLEIGSLNDIHRDKIDHLEFEINGKKYRRINDVMDCWFESGTVPFFFSAENQYETVDFIAEGLDQTRGWFYTLLVLGYCCQKGLYGKAEPPFKNVMVNGLVLAKDGKKMSKSLNNYTSPNIIVDKYGADSLRMYLLSSQATKAEDLKFDDNGVRDIMKNIQIPLYNTLQFLNIFYNVHKNHLSTFENQILPNASTIKHPLNMWILSKLTQLENTIHDNYSKYQLNQVILNIKLFIEVLNNCYIKVNRPIMKNQERDPDINDLTVESINVTALILLRISYLMAPIAPYFSEYLFQNTKKYFNFKDINNESIHLTEYEHFYSLYDNTFDQEQINIINYTENQFKLLDYVRRMRAENNIPQTKAIKNTYYISNDFDVNSKAKVIDQVFIDEMNFLNIHTLSLNEMKINPIKLIPKINIKLISQTFKKDANKVKEFINNLDEDKLDRLYNKEILDLEYKILPEMIDEWKYSLINKKMLYDFLSLTESNKLIDMVGSNFVLIFDTTYDKDMIYTHFVQNVARQFQKMRKCANLNPWDPIKLYLNTDNQMVIDIFNNTKNQSLFFEITHRALNLNLNSNNDNYIYTHLYQCNLEETDLDLNLKLGY